MYLVFEDENSYETEDDWSVAKKRANDLESTLHGRYILSYPRSGNLRYDGNPSVTNSSYPNKLYVYVAIGIDLSNLDLSNLNLNQIHLTGSPSSAASSAPASSGPVEQIPGSPTEEEED